MNHIFCTASLFFALLLLGNNSTHAQEPPSFEQKVDQVYGDVHGTGLLMDVFTPKDKPNGLAIIDVASGAWYSDRGKIRDHMRGQFYQIFCGRGYVVFAIRPGSRTRYTAREMDQHVKMAIRYVKEHAADYKIDPERLGITGASAGGHLATLASVNPEGGDASANGNANANANGKNSAQRNSTRIKAAAVFFPPIDFLDWGGQPADMNRLGDLLFLGGTKGHTDEEIQAASKAISPVYMAQQAAGVPFLFIHGDADPLVPLQQSEKMVAALKAAGGSAELIVKKGGGHPWLTIHEEVKVMADWFDRNLAISK